MAARAGLRLLALLALLAVRVASLQTGWKTLKTMDPWSFVSRFCFRGDGAGDLRVDVKYKLGGNHVRARVSRRTRTRA